MRIKTIFIDDEEEEREDYEWKFNLDGVKDKFLKPNLTPASKE